MILFSNKGGRANRFKKRLALPDIMEDIFAMRARVQRDLTY
jgi:hypothetical protein